MQTWINNEEDSEFVGVGARFGTTIQTKEKYASRTPLSLSDPSDCCTAPKEKVCYSVIFEVVHTVSKLHLYCSYYLFVSHVRLLETFFWCIVEGANLQRRQRLLKLLVLLLY